MKAGVEYLYWAKRAKAPSPRISLLESGLVTPLDSLGVDPRVLLEADPPETGSERVRGGVAARYGVEPPEVLPVLGTSLALYLAAAALLEPGDRVLVEHPAYESLWRVPESLGARVARFSRSSRAEEDLLACVLSAWEEGTRLVLLSDLHNPWGRAAIGSALARLAGELADRGAFLFVDEVYRDFRPGPVGTARTLGANVIVGSSLTKVYGLGKLRAGWILGPQEVLDRASRIRDRLHAVDPAPLEPLFVAGLEQADRLREVALSRAEQGWATVRTWLRENPGLDVIRPDGGIHAWCRLDNGWTSTHAARVLRDRFGVGVVPGHFFGDETGVRFGFSGTADALAEGLGALAEVLAQTPPLLEGDGSSG